MKTLTLLALTLTSLSAHAATDFPERVGHKQLELAHVMIKAYDGGAICETDAYPSEISKLVQSARYKVAEATMKKFVKAVNPKSKINSDLSFREALGRINLNQNEPTEADAMKALLGTTYFHFGQGAYGSGYNVTLNANGVADEEILELLDDAPWTRRKKSRTTWSIVPNKAATFLGHNLRVGSMEFRLEAHDGDYWWVPIGTKEGETDYQNTLSSSDSFCDA